MHHRIGHGKWSVRLADCLSQGDFWPAETHRDPSGDKPQHELAGVTIKGRNLEAPETVARLDGIGSETMIRPICAAFVDAPLTKVSSICSASRAPS